MKKKNWLVGGILAGALAVLLSAGMLGAQSGYRFPMPCCLTIGSLMVATDANGIGAIDAVATGSVLTSAGTGTVPVWSTSTVAEVADGRVFMPAPENCTSDTPAASMIRTRVAASDWALARTAAGAETYNIHCALGAYLQRTTALKGIKITALSIVHQITVVNLTTNTWGKLSFATYANNVANSIGADLSTPPTLPTVVQANPYVTAVPIAAAAYTAASLTGLSVEWTAVMANTGVYRLYGIEVAFSRTDH